MPIRKGLRIDLSFTVASQEVWLDMLERLDDSFGDELMQQFDGQGVHVDAMAYSEQPHCRDKEGGT